MARIPDTAKRDYGLRGFFTLRLPEDLFAKMKYDYRRMLADRTDAYAAFDFFVTANHLVDWIWPSSGRQQQKLDRQEHPISRICEHLADGAKHFILTSPHRGVAHADVSEGVFDSAIFDPDIFDTGELIIEFEPAEAKELGYDSMSAVGLAKEVLDLLG